MGGLGRKMMHGGECLSAIDADVVHQSLHKVTQEPSHVRVASAFM